MLNGKVLFVLLLPLPYAGAAWTRIEFFANYLKAKNCDVAVLGTFSPKTLSEPRFVLWNGFRIYNLIPSVTLGSYTLSGLINILASLLFSFILFLFLRPKTVMISVPSTGSVLGCYLAARIFGSKVITDYRDEWEDYHLHLFQAKTTKIFLNILKGVMKRCYRRSEVIVTVTEPLRNSLKRRGISNIAVIPNGADLEVFRPKDKISCREKIGVRPEDFILVYTGYFGSYYRIDLLLYALRKVVESTESNTKLILIGHGVGLESILKLADTIDIRDKIIYLGKIIDKEELSSTLSAADVGIIPYDTKPLAGNAVPVKSLEYLACGLPIVAVAYKNTLLGRMIIDNKLGFVAEPDDTNSLSEAISKVSKDPDMRTSSSLGYRRFVLENYDRRKIAAHFQEVIDRYIIDNL